MSELIGEYKNGNYNVRIYSDGTKIRETEEDEFIPEFPECMDVNISTLCSRDCNFCFVGGTQILMEDFTTKNIEDIKIGDKIIGFEENSGTRGKLRSVYIAEVTNTFVHVEEELIQVTTENGGNITATPNHPFMCTGCKTGHTVKFNRLENIIKSDNPNLYTLGFPIKEYINYDSENYKKGYIVGAWCGDGTRCKNLNIKRYEEKGKEEYYYLCRFVTKDQEINDRVMDYAKVYFPEFYFNDFNLHGDIRKAVTNATAKVYNELNAFIEKEIHNNITKEYACGFLAGIFDTEGTIGKIRKIIRISNTNIKYIEEIERCLDILGLTYCREKRTFEHRMDIYNVRVKGTYQWNKFLWYTRPVCDRKSFERNIFDFTEFQITKIIKAEKIVKKQYVYNLETTSHTYIANNFMVHNCYANCSLEGKNADFDKYFNNGFFDGIRPYTEIAININSIWHPGLINFLERMKERKVIVNATINQKDFEKSITTLKRLTEEKLIWGLGISLNIVTEDFIEEVKKFPNAIIHIINGIVRPDQIKELSNNGLKLLILGYKQIGRGIDWYTKTGEKIKKRQNWINDNLKIMANKFEIISFDNLACEQLNVKSLISEEQYEERFLGKDGFTSFYLNLVNDTFALNSLSSENECYPIEDKTIDECFNFIKNVNK